MDAKLTQLTIVVQDQAAALAFYTETRGFAIKTDVTPPDQPGWVTVGPADESTEIDV